MLFPLALCQPEPDINIQQAQPKIIVDTAEPQVKIVEEEPQVEVIKAELEINIVRQNSEEDAKLSEAQQQARKSLMNSRLSDIEGKDLYDKNGATGARYLYSHGSTRGISPVGSPRGNR